MYNFEYARPKTLSEALKLLANDETHALAGGQTMIPTLKMRLASPKMLVDLAAIDELTGISEHGKDIMIKAMTTHGQVSSSQAVQETLPALAKLAGEIGDPQVRHLGTIGGSLANNDPAADYAAGVLALNAVIITNDREIPADDFFQGLFTTCLDDGEIITAIKFPRVKRASYVKFKQPASRYALVGVFVAVGGDGVRVAVTGAGEDGVFRAKLLEDALNRDFSPKALDGVSFLADGLISDIHGSPDYRASLITTLAMRALEAA